MSRRTAEKNYAPLKPGQPVYVVRFLARHRDGQPGKEYDKNYEGKYYSDDVRWGGTDDLSRAKRLTKRAAENIANRFTQTPGLKLPAEAVLLNSIEKK